MAVAAQTSRPPPPSSPEGIRALRERLGLKQADLALILGVHAITVCRWEGGSLSPSNWAADLLNDLARCPAPDKAALKLALQRGVGATLALLLRPLCPDLARDQAPPAEERPPHARPTSSRWNQ